MPQTVAEIIAKALPYVKGMREQIAADVVAEIERQGYVITHMPPDVTQVPSAHMAHYRKRNSERKGTP